MFDQTSDGRFRTGRDGVRSIETLADGTVEFVRFAEHTLACVRSSLGYPAYYPVPPIRPQWPIRAVLMDLDGTSVRSEEFWIEMIERTVATILARRPAGRANRPAVHSRPAVRSRDSSWTRRTARTSRARALASIWSTASISTRPVIRWRKPGGTTWRMFGRR